jgi:hypothetical protein
MILVSVVCRPAGHKTGYLLFISNVEAPQVIFFSNAEKALQVTEKQWWAAVIKFNWLKRCNYLFPAKFIVQSSKFDTDPEI